MNKRIDFTKLGGYPLAQEDLDFLQQSYREALGALAAFAGEMVIITGMQEAGGNVSTGWISTGAELVPFEAGPMGTGEFIIEEIKSGLNFQDGGIQQVLITKRARFSSPGTYNYNDLVRLGNVKTLKTALDTLTTAFNTHTHAWAAITGKPTGYISHVQSTNIGDIPSTDSVVTIAIPDQGMNTYVVAGSMRGLNVDWNADNDITWIVTAKTSNSFKVALREFAAQTQQLVFDFAIIKTV